MIKLLDGNKQVLHLLNQVKDYSIQSDLKTADKLIRFKIPRVLDAAANIKEELYLLTPTDEYVIKEINYSDNYYVEVYGKLNLDSLKGKIKKAYDSTEQTVDVFLTDLLGDTDWTYSIINPVTKSRTIRAEVASVHDLIIDMCNTYGLEVVFDTINKVVKVYQTIGTDRGAYAFSALNIKATDYQSDTYDFITRIYPYGKDGLSIADINGGLEYLTNNQYSSKIIEYVWKDERYTDVQSLFDDAANKLNEISQPRISITLDVSDLAKINPLYSILDYQLGDTITVLDSVNGTRYVERIMKLITYPLEPEKNVIEMSNTKLSFVEFTKETAKNVDNLVQSITSEITGLGAAINDATNKITGNHGGFIVIRYNPEEQPYEILIMDTPDIATATNIWRWNSNGLGFSSTGYNGTYGLAITSDGKIVADFITAGTFNGAIVQAGTVDMRGSVVRNDDNKVTLSISSDGDISMQGTLQSDNYTEDTGWKIDEAGTATLNEAIVRGSLILPTAGATNIDYDSNNKVRFYAGSSYETRNAAPFRVLEDGTVIANLGQFGGTFTGSLVLGDIHITDETGSTDGSAIIQFIHDDGSTTVTPVYISANGTHFTAPFYIGDEDDRRFIIENDAVVIKTNSLRISQTENEVTAAKDIVFPNSATDNLIKFNKNSHNIDIVGNEMLFNANSTPTAYNFKFRNNSGYGFVKMLIDGSAEVSDYIGYGTLKIKKKTDSGNAGIDFTFE